jgi:hypothetical protein
MAKRLPLVEVPGGPDPREALAEIRRLYFGTTAATIERDFDRAIDLIKSLPTLEDRQKAHVFMEGLAEMRKEWKKPRRSRPPRS